MHGKNRQLVAGYILTLVTGIVLIAVSCIMGRNQLFLLLNTDLGKGADYFFRFWTNLGDGSVWVLIAVLFFFYRRSHFPLLISCIVLSTLFTQVTKIWVIPAEPRPTSAITDTTLIHTVKGVELHTAYSFPSGHTGTAFCIFLLGCMLVRRSWILPAGFLYAVLVGYSRVYLAQHFPLDVGGGMIVALLSVWLSILVQRKWEERGAGHS